MVPQNDPLVVYAMVTALVVALAVGIFFATPLRILLTGPEESSDSLPFEDAIPDDQDVLPEGPWSTATPRPDQNWPGSGS